jgi:hypothetical protein
MMMFDMLQDMPPEKFRKGVKIMCLKHKELYPGTNIVAYIREYGLVDQNRMNSAEAWGEVLRQVSSTGSYGVPVFSDDIVKRAVECVGWREICMSENIGVERAHFMRAYDRLVERENFNAISGE